jgi:Protein of unknown function (DUF3455)
MINARIWVRTLAVAGMAAVTAAVGAVSYQASAAETVAPTSSDARNVAVPIIATAIKPPAGSRLIGAYLVETGTQTYTCNNTGTGVVGGSTPEAQLIGTGGRVHHFAGPSWQSERDGSLVTAAKIAESPRTGTIPELLLQVNSHSGHGIMDKVDYINRLLTSGGAAPTTCTPDSKVAVPYGAVYVFWDAR